EEELRSIYQRQGYFGKDLEKLCAVDQGICRLP
ncbi:unnamed protein product, partial [marine sediment metagenome]